MEETEQADAEASTMETAPSDTEATTAQSAEAELADEPADDAATVQAASTMDAPSETGAADTATALPTAGDDTTADDAGAAVDSADPSPEAAVGASGARSLGDAEEIADRATEAVDRMNETRAAAEAAPEQPTGTDGAAEASAGNGVAAAEDAGDGVATTVMAESPATADSPAAAATADGPATAAGEFTAIAPAERPAPRPTYDGPEPTTMEELLAEQSTEIRSLKHGDVVEGTVVRIDKDEILVDIGAKSEGVISNRELYGRNAESQPQLNIGDVVLVYVLQPESPEGHAVLSLRRAGLERKWRSMQEQLDAGAIIEAPVIDHNKGGLIVDCGIRGFVPISQIVDFPRRPQNEQPRDAAQEIAEKLQPYVGRKLRLKILEVNRKANRLILSEKVALYEERREKRDELFSSLQVGQKVTGTVRSIAPFGVFVDLGGIDGLVHKSELSWNKVNNPEAGYRVGEEVEAEVIDINHERGRISLSIRRLQPDPWHSTVADLKVGDLIDGTVTKIVNFGAFVRVRDGLEGLIHISELSHQRVNHPGDVVHEGQTIKLKIISLDQERHRLGLSLKQAEEAPARPEPSAPRERRPRQERGGYDMSQAVQEPEGGIDNTLAAAFAQVRQQIEETEAARTGSTTDTEPEAAQAPVAEAGAAGETPSAAAVTDEIRGVAEPEIAPQTAAAPALEVGAAGEEPAEATTEPATTAATAEPTAEATAEPSAEPAAEPATTAATAEPTADATGEPTAEPTTEATAEATTEATAEATAEPTAELTAESATAESAEAKPARKPRTSTRSKAEPAAETAGDSPTEPIEGATDAAAAEANAEDQPAS